MSVTEDLAHDDPVRQFRRALPPYLAAHLNVTARVTVYIHRAVHEHGWTIDQLVAECARDTNGIYRPGGLITHRLEQCAAHPPVSAAKPKTRPFCSPACQERGGLIEDPKTGLPIGKCPCRSQPEAGAR